MARSSQSSAEWSPERHRGYSWLISGNRQWANRHIPKGIKRLTNLVPCLIFELEENSNGNHDAHATMRCRQIRQSYLLRSCQAAVYILIMELEDYSCCHDAQRNAPASYHSCTAPGNLHHPGSLCRIRT